MRVAGSIAVFLVDIILYDIGDVASGPFLGGFVRCSFEDSFGFGNQVIQWMTIETSEG